VLPGDLEAVDQAGWLGGVLGRPTSSSRPRSTSSSGRSSGPTSSSSREAGSSAGRNQNVLVREIETLAPLARRLAEVEQLGDSLPPVHHFGHR
jgi:hypothetical protein